MIIIRMDGACPINCSEHGKCQDNGVCQCDIGWYGDLCDLPVCPNNCSSNGECDADSFVCRCSLGYEGVFFLYGLQFAGYCVVFV